MEGKKLYVGNLSYSTNESQLTELFSSYGEVVSAKIIENKGFGFVEMENSSDASKAIKALNETEIDGRSIVVNEAKARS